MHTDIIKSHPRAQRRGHTNGVPQRIPACTAVILAVCALLPIFSAHSAGIELPQGGWRYNRCKDPEFVHQIGFYLAGDPHMDEVGCPENRIRGTFDEAADISSPATLIVNGNAMPLKYSGAVFSRPFSFGTGSNSVEIRRAGQALRTQFYEANAGAIRPEIRIVLTWDTDGTIVDLHVVTPDGEHCWWNDRVLKNGGGLDVHTVEGYGPVIFSTANATPGLYGIYVNYWGNWSGDVYEPTVANVDIILHESTADELRISKKIPMAREGDVVNVMNFRY